MGHVILIWRMFNTPFLFILYKLQVMKVFLSSFQHNNIIDSGVILNRNILRKCIALMDKWFKIYNFKNNTEKKLGISYY